MCVSKYRQNVECNITSGQPLMECHYGDAVTIFAKISSLSTFDMWDWDACETNNSSNQSNLFSKQVVFEAVLVARAPILQPIETNDKHFSRSDVLSNTPIPETKAETLTSYEWILPLTSPINVDNVDETDKCTETTKSLGLKVGQGVWVSRSTGTREKAMIKFIGCVSFEKGVWIGLHLQNPNGFHNGKGYFVCPQNHGIFVERQAITLVPRVQTWPFHDMPLSLKFSGIVKPPTPSLNPRVDSRIDCNKLYIRVRCRQITLRSKAYYYSCDHLNGQKKPRNILFSTEEKKSTILKIMSRKNPFSLEINEASLCLPGQPCILDVQIQRSCKNKENCKNSLIYDSSVLDKVDNTSAKAMAVEQKISPQMCLRLQLSVNQHQNKSTMENEWHKDPITLFVVPSQKKLRMCQNAEIPRTKDNIEDDDKDRNKGACWAVIDKATCALPSRYVNNSQNKTILEEKIRRQVHHLIKNSGHDEEHLLFQGVAASPFEHLASDMHLQVPIPQNSASNIDELANLVMKIRIHCFSVDLADLVTEKVVLPSNNLSTLISSEVNDAGNGMIGNTISTNMSLDGDQTSQDFCPVLNQHSISVISPFGVHFIINETNSNRDVICRISLQNRTQFPLKIRAVTLHPSMELFKSKTSNESTNVPTVYFPTYQLLPWEKDPNNASSDAQLLPQQRTTLLFRFQNDDNVKNLANLFKMSVDYRVQLFMLSVHFQCVKATAVESFPMVYLWKRYLAIYPREAIRALRKLVLTTESDTSVLPITVPNESSSKVIATTLPNTIGTQQVFISATINEAQCKVGDSLRVTYNIFVSRNDVHFYLKSGENTLIWDVIRGNFDWIVTGTTKSSVKFDFNTLNERVDCGKNMTLVTTITLNLRPIMSGWLHLPQLNIFESTSKNDIESFLQGISNDFDTCRLRKIACTWLSSTVQCIKVNAQLMFFMKLKFLLLNIFGEK